MKILDKYLIKNLILTFAFVLFILSIISIVIDYAEKVDAFLSNNAPAKSIFAYYISFIPYICALLFPLFVFIAVIFFTTRIAYKSEVIAMLSSGMSYNRFLLPYAISGTLFSLILLYSNHVIIPKANKHRLKFENKYINYNVNKTEIDAHYRISPTEFIYLKNFNADNKSGYNFSYEKIEHHTLKEKLWAENINWDSTKKQWMMSRVRIRTINGASETLEHYPTMEKKFDFVPADLIEVKEQKQAMTTAELNTFITKETKRGNPALATYFIERSRRWAAPFSVFILTIIGACLASKKVRGGSGVHLAVGIIISAAYIIFMQFSTTFAIKGNLNPTLSVWMPNMVFLILAIYIYKKMKV
jgi:lipopolysaccharide export system permease protein